MDRFRLPPFLHRLLAVALFIGLLGAFKPVLFNEGGAMAKCIAKQQQREMVGEQEVEDYFEAVLFGEGEVGEAPDELVPEDERRTRIETLYVIDRAVAVALLIVAGLLLVPRLLERSPLRHLLPLLSLWLLAEAIGATLNGGKAHSQLTVLAHATRWGLPLVLWGLVLRSAREKSAAETKGWPIQLAVICTALTFAVHGWEALRLHPHFQDLIHGFAARLGVEMPSAVVSGHLRVIGVMDLLLAGTILKWRRPGLFLWMAAWGLITALSRPLTLGLEAWPELAMRCANFALPLLLALVYSISRPAPAPSPPADQSS